MTPTAGRARVLPGQRPLLDRRISLRRVPLRRHAGDLRRFARAYPRRDRARGARGGRGAPNSILSPKTSRSKPASFAPDQGGYGLDALWNDDFHHSAMVALTGRNEAYYTRLPRQRRRNSFPPPNGAISIRGSATSGRRSVAGRPAWIFRRRAFVNYIQNHDQVANSLRGSLALQMEPRASFARWRPC